MSSVTAAFSGDTRSEANEFHTKYPGKNAQRKVSSHN